MTMKNLLISSFMIVTICHSNSALAMLEHDENDLALSKHAPIISGISFDKLVKNENKMGVMTLCFKTNKEESEHASLVFEMFNSNDQKELSLKMIHYSQEETLCSKNMKINIDSNIDTLKKVYRGVSSSISNNNKTYMPAIYERYASWIISNDKLIEGLKQAEEDIETKGSYNCVSYVSKIMRTVGLNNVDFGLWKTNAKNLKILVDSHIQPKPDRTGVNFPIVNIHN